MREYESVGIRVCEYFISISILYYFLPISYYKMSLLIINVII